jgi:hypothetical protein
MQNFRVHAGDQHLFVIGAVEDADPSALRQLAGGTPEKVVLQFCRGRVLEAEYLAALRVDPGHHVLDGAILSGRVHRLEDQQHGIAVGRVMELLERAELRHVVFEQFLVVLL